MPTFTLKYILNLSTSIYTTTIQAKKAGGIAQTEEHLPSSAGH
jgi:hypothetical protein